LAGGLDFHAQAADHRVAMVVHTSDAWKVVLAAVLGVGILLSLYARAPRRAVTAVQLHRVVLAAIILYIVGAGAWLTHRNGVAGLLYAAGISSAALAAWLSRGSSPENPPHEADSVDPKPPIEPDNLPHFDWAAFERGFRVYSERRPEPAKRD
jgi:hypothetical protein